MFSFVIEIGIILVNSIVSTLKRRTFLSEDEALAVIAMAARELDRK
jgi:hypothetical protein